MRGRLVAGWCLATLLVAAACAPAPSRTTAPAASSGGASSGAPAGAAAGTAAAAPASAPAAPPVSFHLALPNLAVSATSLYVGKALGIFEKHGLAPEIAPLGNAPAAVAALQAGEIEFYAGVGTASRAALRGVPIRVVLVALDRSDWQLMGAKGITSVEDLRGKIVGGYGPQTSVSTVLVELLRRRGLEPDSYILRDVGVARAAALANGQVAGTLINSAEWVPLMKDGFPALAYAGAEVEMPQTGLATSISLLQTRRDFARRVVAAVLESIAATSTQKEVAVPVMVQEFSFSPEDAAMIYDLLQGGWRRNGQPSAASLQFEMEINQRELELPEPVRADQSYDFSLVEELAGGR
jgi:ABC-type nitrate/sulfonate/bicarbonate transport system substrate-binding protein